MTRMDEVAEAMANEPPQGLTAAQIGQMLDMKPSYVLALQSKIRKGLGWQAR